MVGGGGMGEAFGLVSSKREDIVGLLCWVKETCKDFVKLGENLGYETTKK